MLRIGGWSPSACSSLADLAGLLLHTPTLQFLLGFPQQLYEIYMRFECLESRMRGPRTSPYRWRWSCAPNLETQKWSESEKHADSEIKTRAATFTIVSLNFLPRSLPSIFLSQCCNCNRQAGGLCQTCLRLIGHRRYQVCSLGLVRQTYRSGRTDLAGWAWHKVLGSSELNLIKQALNLLG